MSIFRILSLLQRYMQGMEIFLYTKLFHLIRITLICIIEIIYVYILTDSIKTKLHMQKVSSFALAVSGPPYYVAGYVPGSKVRFMFADFIFLDSD